MYLLLKCKYIDPTPVDDDSHIDDGAGWSGRLLKQKSVNGDCSIINISKTSSCDGSNQRSKVLW